MDETIAAVRAFNRFYTGLVGALDERFLGADVTLAEARVLFEIARADAPVAAELEQATGLDKGYLSRLLRRFEGRGLVRRGKAPGDGRRRPIELTPAGRTLFEWIDARQRDAVADIVRKLAPFQRGDLAATLATARRLLDPAPARSWSLRPWRTGDLGWLASRQAIFYEETHGWGRGLELNVLEATVRFLGEYQEGRDAGWIAETDGAPAGSVLLTDEGEGIARLRLLYVEPFARGLGVGDALVRACVDFAKARGCRAVTLWTHEVLTSARRLYAAHGFRIVETAVHHDFGKPELGETWRLELDEASGRPGLGGEGQHVADEVQ